MVVVAAAILALVVSEAVFPFLTTNSDEGVYLAQGETLADGYLIPPAPDKHPEAYQPWFSARRQGEYVYKYTPLQGAVLAGSIAVTGSPTPALAVVAAAGVLLLALLVRALGGSHRAGLLAAGLLAASPAFFILSGTHLPYLSSLALLLGFALAAVTGVRRSRPVLFVVAGAGLGLAFFGRPYDALLFGLPVAAWVVTRWWAGNRGRLAAALGWFAVGLLPGLALFLAYNWRATGSPFELPFSLLGGNDSIGFGPRRVLDTDPFVDYTPKLAAKATLRWLVLVAVTVAGGLALLVTAALGVVRDREMPGRRLLTALAATWIVGYGLFWGIFAAAFLWNGANFLGPFYNLPLVAVAVAAGAIALDRLGPVSPRFTKALAAGMALLTVVSTVALVAPNRDRTERRRQVAGAIEAGLPDDGGRQLVLLPALRGPFLQHPFPWLRNRPEVGGRQVYAVHDPVYDVDLIDQWPGHQPYLVSVPGGYNDTQRDEPVIEVTAQQVVSGPAVALRLAVPDGDARRPVQVGFGEPGGAPVATTEVGTDLWLSVRNGRLAVSGDDGRVLAQREASAASEMLRLTADPDSEAPTVIAVPIQVTDAGLDVVVPGELLQGGSDRPFELTARPAQPSEIPNR